MFLTRNGYGKNIWQSSPPDLQWCCNTRHSSQSSQIAQLHPWCNAASHVVLKITQLSNYYNDLEAKHMTKVIYVRSCRIIIGTQVFSVKLLLFCIHSRFLNQQIFLQQIQRHSPSSAPISKCTSTHYMPALSIYKLLTGLLKHLSRVHLNSLSLYPKQPSVRTDVQRR